MICTQFYAWDKPAYLFICDDFILSVKNLGICIQFPTCLVYNHSSWIKSVVVNLLLHLIISFYDLEHILLVSLSLSRVIISLSWIDEVDQIVKLEIK